mmetsp:Transcript_9491/g.9032  ORF Transcript_9491/g.9032 Transcript_9491/m.9032 type:complete len:105 (+) Transcript_9491:3755-4069(+)
MKERILELKKTYQNNQFGFKVPFMGKIKAVNDSDSIFIKFQELPPLSESDKMELWLDAGMKSKDSEVTKNFKGEKQFLIKKAVYLSHTTTTHNVLSVLGNSSSN